MSSLPVISVMMAVHNGEGFLAEAIESILHQTFDDFEFLIIDDGSTDKSPTILSAYAARDDRVRLVSQPNQGLTKSLNTAFRTARGEFIARFDADDIALPQRFERQVSALRADTALVLVGSEVELITHDGLCLGARGHAIDHDEIRRRLLLGDGGALTHPAVMIRQSALKAVGGYDETFPKGQDLDLFLRLSELGKVTNLPDTLLLWRQHDSSINRTRIDLWMPMSRQAIENTIKRIGAAEYAKGLFCRPETIWPVNNPLILGLFAEQKGRNRTAARLYVRAARNAELRRKAIGRLVRLGIMQIKRLLRL